MGGLCWFFWTSDYQAWVQQKHLEGLQEHRTLGSPPEFQIQTFKGKNPRFASLLMFPNAAAPSWEWGAKQSECLWQLGSRVAHTVSRSPVRCLTVTKESRPACQVGSQVKRCPTLKRFPHWWCHLERKRLCLLLAFCLDWFLRFLLCKLKETSGHSGSTLQLIFFLTRIIWGTGESALLLRALWCSSETLWFTSHYRH